MAGLRAIPGYIAHYGTEAKTVPSKQALSSTSCSNSLAPGAAVTVERLQARMGADGLDPPR